MLLIIFALSSYVAIGVFCASSSTRILKPSRHGLLRLSPLRGAQNSQHESPIISAIADVLPTIKERYFFPGHAGGEHVPKSLKKLYGSELFNLDLPELDGLDNIHCPEGPLLRALQLASELFGSSQSWFLVNGSTSGILSAILAAVQIHQRRLLAEKERVSPTVHSISGTSMNAPSDRSIMILGRDSHKASFDGLRLADCDGALLPCVQDSEFGVPLGVDFESISEALETYGSQVQ
jgi:arginine/lysine/ornithine decarboxylase